MGGGEGEEGEGGGDGRAGGHPGRQASTASKRGRLFHNPASILCLPASHSAPPRPAPPRPDRALAQLEKVDSIPWFCLSSGVSRIEIEISSI